MLEAQSDIKHGTCFRKDAYKVVEEKTYLIEYLIPSRWRVRCRNLTEEIWLDSTWAWGLALMFQKGRATIAGTKRQIKVWGIEKVSELADFRHMESFKNMKHPAMFKDLRVIHCVRKAKNEKERARSKQSTGNSYQMGREQIQTQGKKFQGHCHNPGKRLVGMNVMG